MKTSTDLDSFYIQGNETGHWICKCYEAMLLIYTALQILIKSLKIIKIYFSELHL